MTDTTWLLCLVALLLAANLVDSIRWWRLAREQDRRIDELWRRHQ